MSVSSELLCSFELLKPLDSSALKSHIKKGRNKRQQMLNSPVSELSDLKMAWRLTINSLRWFNHRVSDDESFEKLHPLGIYSLFALSTLRLLLFAFPFLNVPKKWKREGLRLPVDSAIHLIHILRGATCPCDQDGKTTQHVAAAATG